MKVGAADSSLPASAQVQLHLFNMNDTVNDIFVTNGAVVFGCLSRRTVRHVAVTAVVAPRPPCPPLPRCPRARLSSMGLAL